MLTPINCAVYVRRRMRTWQRVGAAQAISRSRSWTRRCRTRLESGTTSSAARTTSPPTARSATRSSKTIPQLAANARHVARLPRARRALPGRRGGHPPVPRHRHRPADGEQHPRGGPVAWRRKPASCTSTTTRWCWRTPVPLLTSTPEGATDYLDADMRDTDGILREAARTLDSRPAGRAHVDGRPRPHRVRRRGQGNRQAAHGRAAVGQLLRHVRRHRHRRRGRSRRPGSGTCRPTRSTTCAARSGSRPCFDGLELVEPGVVSVTRWRPDPDTRRRSGRPVLRCRSSVASPRDMSGQRWARRIRRWLRGGPDRAPVAAGRAVTGLAGGPGGHPGSGRVRDPGVRVEDFSRMELGRVSVQGTRCHRSAQACTGSMTRWSRPVADAGPGGEHAGLVAVVRGSVGVVVPELSGSGAGGRADPHL